jgi:molybdate transport system substrate-binding protein
MSLPPPMRARWKSPSKQAASSAAHSASSSTIVNPAGLTTLQDLAESGLRLILAAPEVPVGAYSLDFLERASADPEFGADYSAAVLSNVVSYEENVRAVLSKVLLGEADAGVVYTSDITREATDQVGRLDIPDALNTIADYPIAPVADAPNGEAAQAFIDYVLSPEGQAVLEAYGFLPADSQ